MLVAYSGNIHALECANRLARRLQFVAWGCVYLPGARNVIHKYRMRVRTKPLLFFSRGDLEPRGWWEDLFTSPKVDKDLHAWQQSEGDAEPLFEALTYPGERVATRSPARARPLSSRSASAGDSSAATSTRRPSPPHAPEWHKHTRRQHDKKPPTTNQGARHDQQDSTQDRDRMAPRPAR